MNIPKTELDSLIEQIQAIKIKPKAKPSEPETVSPTVTNTEPNETTAGTEIPAPQMSDKRQNQAADGSISEETLQRLKDLSQTPNQINNPFQLAEILYTSGCLTEAGNCYQAALDRISDEESNHLQDKAWILLQIGNCLKNKDPQAALEKYQTVISEFPLSQWARVAKAKSDAIDWFLKDQPEKVLNESYERIKLIEMLLDVKNYPLHVLIIDEDQVSVRTLLSVLARKDIQGTVAGTAKEAANFMEQNNVDLVFNYINISHPSRKPETASGY